MLQKKDLIKLGFNPYHFSDLLYQLLLNSTYEINKISLSCFDDKRYIHDNGITSYAYDHYMINAPTLPTIEEEDE